MFKKVTLASDPASQNAAWQRHGFAYPKQKLSDFGRIISLPNAKKLRKICQVTAEILWCIACGANINTEALDSQHCRGL